MAEESDRVKLTEQEALAMLPDGDTVHTFRSGFALIGADWPKAEVVQAIQKYGAELSGPLASRMDHGMCLTDEVGPLFIETKPPEGTRK